MTSSNGTVPVVNVQDIWEQYQSSRSNDDALLSSSSTSFFPHSAVPYPLLKTNNLKYENWILRPRMLRDVSRITTNTTYLQGYQSVALPIGIGPCENLLTHHHPRTLRSSNSSRSANSNGNSRTTTILSNIPDTPKNDASNNSSNNNNSSNSSSASTENNNNNIIHPEESNTSVSSSVDVTTKEISNDPPPDTLSYNNYTATCMNFSKEMNIPCILMDYEDLLNTNNNNNKELAPVWIVLRYTGQTEEMKEQLYKIKQKSLQISAIVLRCCSSSSSSIFFSCCPMCLSSTTDPDDSIPSTEKLCTIEDIDWIWNILHSSSSSTIITTKNNNEDTASVVVVRIPSLIGWSNFTSTDVIPFIDAGIEGILLSTSLKDNNDNNNSNKPLSTGSTHPFDLIRPLVYTLAKTKLRSSSALPHSASETISSIGIPTGSSSKVELYLMDDFLRGSSIFKVLALGVKGVFIHHPVSWALYFQQMNSVQNNRNITLDLLFKIYSHEFTNTMQLCGCINISQIGTEYISPRPLSALAVARTFVKRTQLQEKFISPRKIVRSQMTTTKGTNEDGYLREQYQQITKNLNFEFNKNDNNNEDKVVKSTDMVVSGTHLWLRRMVLVGISTYFFVTVYGSLNGNSTLSIRSLNQ